MSSVPVRRSPSPEEDSQLADERKRKKMISNRESARRTRARKQQRLQRLINEAAQLQNGNRSIAEQINLRASPCLRLEEENTMLRSQVAGLTERLQSLNSVLYIFQVVSGVPMDGPQTADPLLKQRGPPFAAQTMTAMADMVQF